MTHSLPIHRHVENGLQRLTDRFFRVPAGQFLGLGIHHDYLAVDVAGDNPVTDGLKSNCETFLFSIDLGFELFSFGDVAHHRDAETLLVNDHFAQ
jgi:hypothetical protein